MAPTGGPALSLSTRRNARSTSRPALYGRAVREHFSFVLVCFFLCVPWKKEKTVQLAKKMMVALPGPRFARPSVELFFVFVFSSEGDRLF